MKRIVWTFGLIAGAVMSIMMALSVPFMDGSERAAVVGYTGMVLAFLMIFFGIKSYRDNVAGGMITFGRALAVGLLITAVASACYVATWEVIYFKFMPDFGDKYAAHAVEQARKSGASQAEIDKKTKEMDDFKKMYDNPLINVGFTFLEPLPVGLLIALVSAGVLRRKPTAV
jgi:hypothetical protein